MVADKLAVTISVLSLDPALFVVWRIPAQWSPKKNDERRRQTDMGDLYGLRSTSALAAQHFKRGVDMDPKTLFLRSRVHFSRRG